MVNKNLKSSINEKSRKVFFIVFGVVVIAFIIIIILLGVFPFQTTKSINDDNECREKKYVEERTLVTDKELLNIEWKTEEETFGSVEIQEQEKVNEILKRAFSCDFETKVFLVQPYNVHTQKDEEGSLQRYGCSYSLYNNNTGEVVLNYNGKIYSFGLSETEGEEEERWDYISNIDLADNFVDLMGDTRARSAKTHSVTFDILKPNTTYNFKIISNTDNCQNSEAGVDLILVND